MPVPCLQIPVQCAPGTSYGRYFHSLLHSRGLLVLGVYRRVEQDGVSFRATITNPSYVSGGPAAGLEATTSSSSCLAESQSHSFYVNMISWLLLCVPVSQQLGLYGTFHPGASMLRWQRVAQSFPS